MTATRSSFWIGALVVPVFVASTVGMILVGPAESAESQYCMGQRATIVGTSKIDRIEGTDGPDVIVGLGGADEIKGNGGDDTICGGPGGKFGNHDGTERIWGDDGDDVISGGSGSERIYGGRGKDTIFGGRGRDLLFGDYNSDVIRGGRGRDLINGGDGNDRIHGGSGSDRLAGDRGDDLIRGGKGSADLAEYAIRYFDRDGSSGLAGSGVKVDLSRSIGIGPGRDRLFGIEDVQGTFGDDLLIGDDRDNYLAGLSGDDVLRGKGGSDCLQPGNGTNALHGGKGFDFYTAEYRRCSWGPYHGTVGPIFTDGVTVDLAEGVARYNNFGGETTLHSIEGAYGSSEEDHLIGDDGPNRLFGLGAYDVLEGNGGDDHLDGGFGSADSADGGDGNDTCVRVAVRVACE